MSQPAKDEKKNEMEEEPEIVKFSPEEEAVRPLPPLKLPATQHGELTRGNTGAAQRVEYSQS